MRKGHSPREAFSTCVEGMCIPRETLQSEYGNDCRTTVQHTSLGYIHFLNVPKTESLCFSFI